jgi:hypothetical protein
MLFYGRQTSPGELSGCMCQCNMNYRWLLVTVVQCFLIRTQLRCMKTMFGTSVLLFHIRADNAAVYSTPGEFLADRK